MLLRAAIAYIEGSSVDELGTDYMDALGEAGAGFQAAEGRPLDGVFYDGVNLDGDGKIGCVVVEWVAGT